MADLGSMDILRSAAPRSDENVERRIIEIGREIFRRARHPDDRFLRQWPWDQWLMDFGMQDEHFKAQLFRFVDVLAVLKTPGDINRHLKEYLDPVRDRLPGGAALPWMPERGPMGRALAQATGFGARRMARQFIAGSDLREAAKTIVRLRRRKLAFTIDLLGEATVSEAEAIQYQQEYLRLVEGLCDRASFWPGVDLADNDNRGPIPRVNISIKLSSLYSQFDPIDPERASRAVRERLIPILELARRRGAFVNIDMEQYAFKDLTLRIFKEIFFEPPFGDWADVGIAMQAYLRDTADDLRDLAEWSKARGTPVWVRLVKGAYWDFESVIAAQNGWALPVFDHKPQTDANFEQLTTFLMEHHRLLRPAIASHNIRSIAHALAQAERIGLSPRSYEFQMLYGMAEPVKSALVKMGRRVRVYTPYGQLLPGMAYLVRRLLENTSNESFLRAGFHERIPEEQLLMNPIEILRRRQAVAHPHRNGRYGGRPFANEALADFSRESARQSMRDALYAVSKRLGLRAPLVIGGQRIETTQWINSINPSHRKQAVGSAGQATVDHANQAIRVAKEAFEEWRDAKPAYRAQLLFRAAQILRRRKWELSAWEVYETAKGWREADADVAEAIDYCEYYGRQALRLAQPQNRNVPGEDNTYFHEPRGVAAIIAPWNFPLAILCGMTTAALVTGNTAIMKPAEQSPIIASMLMEVFEEAGFPRGVVNYLPGIGEEIGPVLIGHPDVATIAFTGSRAVGLAIQRQGAELAAGQTQLKKVITEMGGKNATIIDEDCDVDDAVHGVVASAFGYSGQKCSACSRAIVLPKVYDTFLARLIEAARSLHIGPAEEAGAMVGPVIDADAQRRILAAIEKGKSEAKLVYQAELGNLAEEGCYVAPTIFADVPEQSTLAQEEIFGPVLAVIRAADLDEALRIANGTSYALTGGIFSRSPVNIERARQEFRVGNLYINRKITGALVDRQPFGGFKLSGTGAKAGGPDYLLQFMQARTITENTLRHGFAPQNPGAFSKPSGE